MTKREALDRTKAMLVSEWRLLNIPLSTTSLRGRPPQGLGANDGKIRALEGPIELFWFQTAGANVVGDELVKATTVGSLRDKIYAGISSN